MIRVLRTNKIIEINGHSGFADYGKDIVCSAVSGIVITTINGIISIDQEAISYDYHNDKMLIELKKEDVVVVKLLDNMIELLKELMKKYPNNINVKEK